MVTDTLYNYVEYNAFSACLVEVDSLFFPAMFILEKQLQGTSLLPHLETPDAVWNDRHTSDEQPRGMWVQFLLIQNIFVRKTDCF